MTKLCLVICATLAYITVAAAQCQLATFVSCKHTAEQQKWAALKTLEPSLAPCFTANQCAAPKMGEHEEHKDEHHSGSGSATFAAEEATRNQSRQCREAVESACINAITSVSIPEEHKRGPRGGEKDCKEEMKEHLKAACKNSTVTNATGAVETCLKPLFTQAMAAGKTFCEARDACVATALCTNATLKAAMEKQRNATHKCREEASATKQTLAATVSQCAGLNLTAVFERREKHGKEEHKEGPKGEHKDEPKGADKKGDKEDDKKGKDDKEHEKKEDKEHEEADHHLDFHSDECESGGKGEEHGDKKKEEKPKGGEEKPKGGEHPRA